MELRVTNIQRGCIYDGPGVRTTVFLKGCTMRCPWCCNPETISPEEEYFIDNNKCLLNKGIVSKLCTECERNGGRKSIVTCPLNVCEPTSHNYSTEALFDVLSKDFELMRTSGGGVTFSGGEPLLQIDALEPILEHLKKKKISVAFETTLTTCIESIQKVGSYANILIVDIKLQPQHPLYNNHTYIKRLEDSISFYRSNHIQMIYRLVVTKGMLNDAANIISYLKQLGVYSVELLKCHNLGQNKYNKLGLILESYTPSDLSLNSFLTELEYHDINADILTI